MRDLSLVILGALIGVLILPAFPKTYDERKWEALQANREARRQTERRYESCARQCQESCK